MARIHPPDAKSITENTAGILKEIEGAFGRVPNLFKTYAHHPPLLEANWNKVKALMMEGRLSRKMKEAIAVLVSEDNRCRYCVSAHSAALQSIGVSDEEIKKILDDVGQTTFSPKEQALIHFARRANREPLNVSDSDFASLRQLGADDAEIVEALGVMEIFTAFNKFLDSLQVDVDF